MDSIWIIPGKVVCCSTGDVGGAKQPEGDQWAGVASVRWLIIDMVGLLTCICVSNINNDNDEKVVIVLPHHSFVHSSGAVGCAGGGHWCFCRCWSSFWGGCVWCMVLLSLLGGCGHLLGG